MEKEVLAKIPIWKNEVEKPHVEVQIESFHKLVESYKP